MTLKKRRIIFLFCGIFFLVLAPILLFYSLGYRLDKNFRIGRTGGLYVSSPVSGSEIFVKNKQEKKTNILQNGLFLQNLKTGIYPILITKDGYWPWLLRDLLFARYKNFFDKRFSRNRKIAFV